MLKERGPFQCRLHGKGLVLVLAALCSVHGAPVEKCEGNCVDGEGTYSFSDGTVYTGSFQESRFHGKGEMHYTNGEVYVGKFKHGKRHGRGVLRYPIDSSLGSLRHGSFSFTSGADYEGDFVDGAFHGWGVYTYPDKSVFSGQFVRGKREGKGFMEMPTGDKYEGTWRNNEWDPAQGKPVYYRADGKTQEL